jgi:hypothetical protein
MEENISLAKTTLQRILYRNIKRINCLGNREDSFNDVLTKVLDFYEDNCKIL